MEIKVGLGTCGISAGGKAVFAALQQGIAERNLDVTLKETGCMGMCYEEVLVEVNDNADSWLYAKVTPEKVTGILDQHSVGKQPVSEWMVKGAEVEAEDPFFDKQERIVLRNCGIIDPSSIEEYIARSGYEAARKVLTGMSPEDVIDTVFNSGLRGRGGGGFPTGLKWRFARQSAGEKKYVVCNADEGDPGAFMDRSILEGDPHSVLEGMIIAGYAIGADEGYIYARAEYPLAIRRLKLAIRQCEERGLLGDDLFGSGFSFRLKIKEGAGAFVCGEETALIASIEGKRGVPRIRPPFPAQKGLWDKPTNINNVETYANVPWIILNGADAYAAFGGYRARSPRQRG